MSSIVIDNAPQNSLISNEELINVETNWVKFYETLSSNWEVIYNTLIKPCQTETFNGELASNALNLINALATTSLTKYVDFEYTIGEINRIPFDEAKSQIELYISPKLLIHNVKIMELGYSIGKKYANKLHNLTIVKYRAASTDLIDCIEYKDFTANYSDFGCQAFHSISSETNLPIVNLVILVKQPLASTLLEKRVVVCENKSPHADIPAKPITLEKWLPKRTQVIDLILLNVIGEYNLIHNTGYIEFLPEDDPLITQESVFNETSDLKNEYELLITNKMKKYLICAVCNRSSNIVDMLRCSKCKTTHYCGNLCQLIDFPSHKKYCK